MMRKMDFVPQEDVLLFDEDRESLMRLLIELRNLKKRIRIVFSFLFLMKMRLQFAV